jgi:enoyl-CoA hydratase/carnithine racemase
MTYREIRCEGPADGVLRITLDRPEKRNPLSPAMMGELVAALAHAQGDQAVRVCVLTGAGKVFSAGGDLSMMGGAPGAGGGATSIATLPELIQALAALGKPTIAMLNGHALAGGFGLALACDLIVASDAAQLGTPEIQVGLWPMMIMALIVRHVPRKKAMEWMLLGERISADEAARWGLVNRVVPAAQLEEETGKLARTLAAKSPSTLRMGLRAFHETDDLPLERSLPYLAAQLAALIGTEDAREGLMAFLEKRAPRWTGR